MITKAKLLVLNIHNTRSVPNPPITINDVYVVWFCKTLQNWKALVSTNVPDCKYYEVTYDGDKKQTYVDVYVKLENEVITD